MTESKISARSRTRRMMRGGVACAIGACALAGATSTSAAVSAKSTQVDLEVFAGETVPIAPGATFVATAELTNHGPGNAGPTSLIVTLPPKSSGVTPVDVHGGVRNGDQVSWTVPSIKAGVQIRRKITFKVAKNASLPTSATVFTPVPVSDPTPGDDSITLPIQATPPG